MLFSDSVFASRFGITRQDLESYLSEAFPNPQRIGCPPISELACMAELRRDADSSISEHLSRCSPCFKEYMEILAYVIRRNNTGLGGSC